MNSFFLLNNSTQISTDEQYSGYVVFYKKSKEISVAEIQQNLYSKLIENALKLKMEHFLFIDVSEQKERFSQLKKTIEIQKCFLFGVNEKEVGINFDIPLYKLMTVSSIQFLRTDAPEMLEQDKNLKNKLWAQLQISFNINQ